MEARSLPVAAALAGLSATVALAFGQVFASGRYAGPLLAAALLPHAIGLVVRWRRGTVLHAWAAWILGLAVFAVVVLGDLSPATLVDRIRTGWDLVETQAVPISATDGTIALGAIVMWLAAAAADDLAFWRHASVGALAPGAVVLIWIIALGDRDGQWVAVAGFGMMAIAFLALQHQMLLERRRTRLGDRKVLDAPSLVVLALVVGVGAVAFGVAAAPALPGGDRPLFEAGGLSDGGGDQSYRTTVPPLLDVGDKLTQGTEQELFTVDASGTDYWRITALDQYRSAAGGQWTLTAEGDDAVGEGLDESLPRNPLIQTYRIGNLGERWMPAAYRPVQVDGADPLIVRSSNTLVTPNASVAGSRYRVVSDPGPTELTDNQRERAAAPAPESLAEYTELPDDFPQAVRLQAEAITAGVTSSFDKALALRDYFRDGSFTYDPTVELGDDQSAISTFLLQKRGFCVQFASAYATMARSVGLPTRVAVGFTPGTPNDDGVYSVTNWDAHAWPEVWLDGLGWTHLFDPTPPSADPGGSDLPSEPAQSEPPPPAETTPSTTVSQDTTPATTPTSGDTTTATTEVPSSVTVDPGATTDEGGSVPWPVFVIAALLLIILVPAALIVLAKSRRRSRRRSAPDPSDAIRGAWSEAVDALTDRRVGWPASDTPYEAARRVPVHAGAATAEPMAALADAYTEARYGSHTPSTTAADRAWDDVDALRRALDASAPFVARMRARLDLRTLRRQPEPAGWSLRRRSSTND
jgi:transglutaminase-like putative cysteine protease